MPITTEAYVIREANAPFQIEDIVIDEVRSGEVLIETVAFSVCASDIKAAHGTFHLKPPLVPGHEASGVVKQVGDNVTSVRPGDLVVLSFANCSACTACKDAAPAYCEKLFAYNFSGERVDGTRPLKTATDGLALNGLFFGQSSMSKLLLAHDSSVVPLPASTTREELPKFATLGCGMQTGAGAILNVAKPKPGARVVIIGCGAVGLAAALAALTTKPSHIVIIDNDPRKFELIPAALRKLPSSSDTDPSTAHASDDMPTYDLSSGVKVTLATAADAPAAATSVQAAMGEVGATHIIDCAGLPGHISALMPVLAKRGMMLTVGGTPPTAPKVEADVTNMLVGGKTYRGTHQGDSIPREFIPKMIDMWRDGDFGFDELARTYKFEELEQGLEDLKNGKVIKVVCVV